MPRHGHRDEFIPFLAGWIWSFKKKIDIRPEHLPDRQRLQFRKEYANGGQVGNTCFDNLPFPAGLNELNLDGYIDVESLKLSGILHTLKSFLSDRDKRKGKDKQDAVIRIGRDGHQPVSAPCFWN